VYGAVEPTAVWVPLKEMLKEENFEACTTEIFAPFQVVTTFADNERHLVIDACERMSNHLTAAVVSNDVEFQTDILANTVNGTTYAGRRARTTGAPQNHWFGPAGDTRGAGKLILIKLFLVLSGFVMHSSSSSDALLLPVFSLLNTSRHRNARGNQDGLVLPS
jgi:hypothetical protein